MAAPLMALCTTWSDVETRILSALRRLPACRPFDSLPVVAPTGLDAWWTSALEGMLPARPDAVLNTLRHLFFHARCGVLVAVRDGRVVLCAPFANSAYTNTWSHRLETDVDLYARRKASASGKPLETLLPPAAWWLNGGVVCNVMPADVWGAAHLPELLEQLHATAVAHGPLPDCTFFFNKRDYPQLRRDGTDALARFTGESRMVREAYTHHAPIVSFYGGSAFVDCVAPLSEDWRLAREAVPRAPTDDATKGWEAAAASAVWRGAPTGYDLDIAHNQRLALVCAFARKPTIVDALLVCSGPGGRDRLCCAADSSSLHLAFFDPMDMDPPPPMTRTPMPLEAQRAAFRYIVYVDGHCAANRFGALMHAGRVILKVTSMHDADGGRQWLFPFLVGMRIALDGSVSIHPAGSTRAPNHCIIDADLSNIEVTIQHLNAHDAEARALARAAAADAPTCHMVTATWSALLQRLNSVSCDPQPALPGHEVWFSPFDPEYARCGKQHSSVFYSTALPT
jgi:hypothetical protein